MFFLFVKFAFILFPSLLFWITVEKGIVNFVVNMLDDSLVISTEYIKEYTFHLEAIVLNLLTDLALNDYVHPPGGWIYYFCFFRRPMSGVTHGFRSFIGKVLELLSPNLVCRLIGSVACLGLLLAVVPLLLTE